MITEGLKGRDFLRLQDFSKAELEINVGTWPAVEG